MCTDHEAFLQASYTVSTGLQWGYMIVSSQISDDMKTQQVEEILLNKYSNLNLQNVRWFLYPEQ